MPVNRPMTTIYLNLVLIILLMMIVTACVQIQNTEGDQQTESRPATTGEPVKPGTSGDVKDLPTVKPHESGTPVQEVNPRRVPPRPEQDKNQEN